LTGLSEESDASKGDCALPARIADGGDERDLPLGIVAHLPLTPFVKSL
jgi:hypothetical protein